MLEDDKYSVDDLISNAADQKPTEFENTFSSLVMDRIRTAVETKKQEIAAQMYNYNPETEASGE